MNDQYTVSAILLSTCHARIAAHVVFKGVTYPVTVCLFLLGFLWILSFAYVSRIRKLLIVATKHGVHIRNSFVQVKRSVV